ncbi:hypothetical protein AVEN_265810-1 [Araneus ventricosus]|uniref:Uncharacterized protein n=1 Tax=Araneus ventricosus TaxID=182803 RepID=A0A4Y2DWC1_ARAVE|nr:hypothetical protein AVEN_265810-1 [Araneus ventricosus]
MHILLRELSYSKTNRDQIGMQGRKHNRNELEWAVRESVKRPSREKVTYRPQRTKMDLQRSKMEGFTNADFSRSFTITTRQANGLMTLQTTSFFRSSI